MDRLYPVDALRAFCIVIVMGFHFFNPAPGHYGPTNPILNTLEPLFRHGELGVTGFFVVSGFLITRLLTQGGLRPQLPLREFYIRRFARLMPLLLVFVGLGWAAHIVDPSHARVLFGEWPGVYPAGFWLSVLFFFYNWYAILMVGPDPWGLHWRLLWSLAVEEQFYLFFPMAIRKLFEPRRVLGLLFALACIGVLFRAWLLFHMPPGKDWGRSTPAIFDPLALGAASYLIWNKVRQTLERKRASSFLLALSGGWITVQSIVIYNNQLALLVLIPTLLSIGCSLFLIGACSLPRQWDPLFKPAAWVGGLSYGLYLLHVSVYFFLAPFLIRIPSTDLGALLYFVVSFGVAWVCYRYYELPANLLIRSFCGLKKVS